MKFKDKKPLIIVGYKLIFYFHQINTWPIRVASALYTIRIRYVGFSSNFQPNLVPVGRLLIKDWCWAIFRIKDKYLLVINLGMYPPTFVLLAKYSQILKQKIALRISLKEKLEKKEKYCHIASLSTSSIANRYSAK